MKKYIILIGIFQFVLSGLSVAQWTPINTGLGSHNPTSMYGWDGIDVVWLATAGGGVFKTLDNGDNWININGDLANLFVNDIKPFGTGTSMFVSTEGGPFFTMDEITYTNVTSTGLTNTDINYFGYGFGNVVIYAICTDSGGVFWGNDWAGPWNAASNGLSGNSLKVNALYYAELNNAHYVAIATDDGVFFADSTYNLWTQKINGLSGAALTVKEITGLGSGNFIATHGGLFRSSDLGDNWIPMVPNHKFNTVSIVPSALSPFGWVVFAFGVNGYYSLDFTNFVSIDLTGITGEITCLATTSTHLLIGVNDGTESGSMYRRPLDQILAIEDINSAVPQEYSLGQNYPNPFNPITTIKYQIPELSFVTLKVFDVLGNEIETLVSEEKSIGTYEITWYAEILPSDVYFYTLQAGDFIETKKMVLMK